eukprot:SAG31_NODE_487_length_14980_cov_9.526376_7_plen_184_part_00
MISNSSGGPVSEFGTAQATRFRSYLQWGPPSRDANLSTTPPTDAATKPIFVYRNFVLSLHFYSIQRGSYSRPDLFLRNAAGEVCLHNRNGSPFWCGGSRWLTRSRLFRASVPTAEFADRRGGLLRVSTHRTRFLFRMAPAQELLEPSGARILLGGGRLPGSYGIGIEHDFLRRVGRTVLWAVE